MVKLRERERERGETYLQPLSRSSRGENARRRIESVPPVSLPSAFQVVGVDLALTLDAAAAARARLIAAERDLSSEHARRIFTFDRAFFRRLYVVGRLQYVALRYFLTLMHEIRARHGLAVESLKGVVRLASSAVAKERKR